jgi:hypothetical protein
MTILRNRGHGVCKLSKSNKQVKLEKRTKHELDVKVRVVVQLCLILWLPPPPLPVTRQMEAML